MKRFGLLMIIGALLATQYGCGHRRACCRSCQPACYTPSLGCDGACDTSCNDACCDGVNGCATYAPAAYENEAPAPVPDVAAPTPAVAPTPPPFAVPSRKRNEPTPADPKTAPKGDFDVAQQPDMLQLNQPTPPPDLY